MRVAVPLVLAAAALSFLAAGCESDGVVGPPSAGGWIEGRIWDGGDPDALADRDVWIDVVAANGSVHGYSTQTDSTGAFRIGVRPGRAVVRVDGAESYYYRAGRPARCWADAETLVVAGGVQRADFPCGRIRVRIDGGADDPLDRWERFALEPVGPVCLPRPGSWGVSIFRPSVRGRSTDDGSIEAEFRCVAPGSYRILGRGSSALEEFFLPATYMEDDADTVAVSSDHLATYTMAPREPCSLAGNIGGAWRAFGFAPPEVSVRSTGGDGAARMTCDEEGRFDVLLPAGGEFLVGFVIRDRDGRGVSPPRWIGGHRPDQATVFALQPGERLAGLEVAAGGLELDLSGDPAMRTIIVRGYPVGHDQPAWSHHTDRVDPVRIAGIQPGSYRIEVVSDGIAMPTFHGDVADLDACTPVDVGAGEVTSLALALRRGARIVGHILDSDGGALAEGFELAVHHTETLADPLFHFRAEHTWDDVFVYDHATGAFEIRKLAAGRYRLRVRRSEEQQWHWYRDAFDWQEAMPVPVADGEDSALEWQL